MPIDISALMLFYPILLFIVPYFAFFFFKWILKYVNELVVINKIPGAPIIPFVGNAHKFHHRTGTKPLIVFHKSDCLNIFLNKSKNIEKAFFYSFLEPWFGTGLLTSHGDKWYKRRRLITPTFHFEILNDFLLVMNEQAEILTKILASLPKNKANEIEVDIFSRLCSCTLDIICESAMGQNIEAQSGRNQSYVAAVIKMSQIILERFMNPFYWNENIFGFTTLGKKHQQNLHLLKSFTKNIIKERDDELRISNYNLSNQKRIAFLDMLLKARQEDPTITYDDIQEEVDTFMFEGHDTTAVAAGWAIHLIGSHSQVQKRLHEEIDAVFGSSERHATNDDLKKLNYLDLVIKESLRIFPSAPFIGRVFEDAQMIGDFSIPKNTTAMIHIYMIHRDEKYFPNPEKFDPDRFLPENTKDRHPLAYIPFSAGPRNCIGQRFAQMEEKVILSYILRKFEIVSFKTTEELKPTTELTLRPMNGIHVKLKPRILMKFKT